MSIAVTKVSGHLGSGEKLMHTNKTYIDTSILPSIL